MTDPEMFYPRVHQFFGGSMEDPAHRKRRLRSFGVDESNEAMAKTIFLAADRRPKITSQLGNIALGHFPDSRKKSMSLEVARDWAVGVGVCVMLYRQPRADAALGDLAAICWPTGQTEMK